MTHPITRRRMLKQTFAFSAALGLTRLSRAFAAEVSPTPAASPGATHILMIGDWGWPEMQAQQAVARAMQRYAADLKITPDALFLLGDNFYGGFKGGTACPRWKTQFEDMYPATSFPGPCHAVLGNHDYDEEGGVKVAAELSYQKDHPQTRWHMPAKWFRTECGPAGNPLLTVLALDTNYKNQLHSLTPEERAAQLAWLKEELAKPRKTPWLALIGHHPLYSNGVHGDSKTLIKELDPLLRANRAHFYFCGHDHDLQHLEFDGHPTSFVVSGGGGARVREPEIHDRGPFSQGIYGFTHLEITKDHFIVRHIDANRKLLHAFTKEPSGKWALLAAQKA